MLDFYLQWWLPFPAFSLHDHGDQQILLPPVDKWPSTSVLFQAFVSPTWFSPVYKKWKFVCLKKLFQLNQDRKLTERLSSLIPTSGLSSGKASWSLMRLQTGSNLCIVLLRSLYLNLMSTVPSGSSTPPLQWKHDYHETYNYHYH